MPAPARPLSPGDLPWPWSECEADTVDSAEDAAERPEPAYPAWPNPPRGGPTSCIVGEAPAGEDRGVAAGGARQHAVEEVVVQEPVDLQRSRLLLGWLQARRALDQCLSELLAAGPAGEQRVRRRLDLVGDLENRARQAFLAYRAVAAADVAESPSVVTDDDTPEFGARPALVRAEMSGGVSGGSPRHPR